MDIRSRSKLEAANTKTDIMAKFEKLRKKGISKGDLKSLGFGDMNDRLGSEAEHNIVESEFKFNFDAKKRSRTNL